MDSQEWRELIEEEKEFHHKHTGKKLAGRCDLCDILPISGRRLVKWTLGKYSRPILTLERYYGENPTVEIRHFDPKMVCNECFDAYKEWKKNGRKDIKWY